VPQGVPRLTVTRARSTADYILEVSVLLRQSTPRLGLIAYGENVCKLADVVAGVIGRLGGDVKIVAWDINSRKSRGRRESYLYVELEYNPTF